VGGELGAVWGGDDDEGEVFAVGFEVAVEEVEGAEVVEVHVGIDVAGVGEGELVFCDHAFELLAVAAVFTTELDEEKLALGACGFDGGLEAGDPGGWAGEGGGGDDEGEGGEEGFHGGEWEGMAAKRRKKEQKEEAGRVDEGKKEKRREWVRLDGLQPISIKHASPPDLAAFRFVSGFCYCC